jgi:hypothetical protein
MFTYLPIPVDEHVPEGYRLIVAYAKDDTIVITIDESKLSEEFHNCDWEGCCTLSHVVSFSVRQKYEMEEKLSKLEKGANHGLQV